MADVTIALTEQVEWLQRRVDKVVLRSPRGNHLQRFGEPSFPVFEKGGASYSIDREEVITRYLDDLLTLDGKTPVDGGGSVFFGQLGLEDALAVREALFSFFTDARRAILSKSLTRSSLTSKSSTSTPATP